MSSNSEIGIIFIGIGKYIMFFDAFYDLCEKNFLRNHKKNYYLITDRDNYYFPLGDNITVIKEKDYGWPNNAMLKFSLFVKYKNIIGGKNSHIFYFNGDALIINEITDEEFLPGINNSNEKLICVQHSVHTTDDYYRLPFEKRKESTSFISTEESSFYRVSGIIGGKKYDFFKHFEEMSKLLKKDMDNNIIPVWHDESLFNHYIVKNKNIFKYLPRTFCFSVEDVYPTKDEVIKIAIRPKYEVGGRQYLRNKNGIDNDYKFNDKCCDKIINLVSEEGRERLRIKGSKCFACKRLKEFDISSMDDHIICFGNQEMYSFNGKDWVKGSPN